MGNVSLGPFLLDAPAARGGMAQVWRGVHRERAVPVAVKVLTAERVRNERFLDFFRNEVRSVAGLDHAHIVHVLDHGEIPAEVARATDDRLAAGSPYLVMEWASGGTLARRAPLARWADLNAILVALLDALAHAHARGVIHRDLKPANVLACGDQDLRPGLKLADFGVAGSPDLGDAESTFGTPAYMAPEQQAGAWRDQGPWTDLYALGCLVVKLTADATVAQVRGELEAGRLPFAAEAPAGLGAWVRRLVERAPARRFQRAADAAWALRLLAEAGPLVRARAAVVPPAEALAAPPAGAGAAAGEASAGAPPDEETRTVAPPADPACAAPPPPAPPAASPAPALPAALAATPGRAPPTAAELPPVPADWRRPAPPGRSMSLHGAGLGLYGLRAVPLVAREPECDTLWGALRQTVGERSARLVVLQGPGGTGKSRLAEWLGERAHETGAASLLAATYGPLGGDADGVVPMILRHARVGGLSRADALARLHLDAAARATPFEEAEALAELVLPATAAERARGRTVRLEGAAERHAVTYRFLERCAAERPVVLRLDDAHWGLDALGLAAHILDVQRTRPAPVLVVLTVLESALAERPAAAAALARVLARPRAQRIDVLPLPPLEHGALVRELLGLEGALAAQVEERTAGNPLFAVQLVGDWIQRGVLVPGERGFVLVPGAHADLPQGMHELWAGVTERFLGGRAAADGIALELAAVLGHEVSFDEWREATGPVPSDAHAVELVEALRLRRLARCGADGPRAGWSFVHGMLRESLERRAREAGRLEAHHRRCAALLRGRSGDGVPERLGRHLLAAGEHEAAIEPLYEGASERSAADDLPGARGLLLDLDGAMAAVGLAEHDVRRGQALVLWAHLARGEGDREGGDAGCRRVLALGAGRPDWSALVARAMLGLATGARERGDLDAALDWVGQAEERFAALGDGNRLASCARVRGLALGDRGRLDEADQHNRRALEGYVAAGNDVGEAKAYVALASSARQRGQIAEGIALAERAQAASERAGSRGGVGTAHNLLGEFARLGGDAALAERHYVAALAHLRSIGSSLAWLVEANLGLVLAEQQRWAEARATLAESLAMFERAGRLPFAAAVHAALLPCAAGLRDWPAWDAHVERAAALLAETGLAEPDVAASASAAGRLARAAGEPARARAAFDIALQQWRRLGRDAEAATVVAALAQLAHGGAS